MRHFLLWGIIRVMICIKIFILFIRFRIYDANIIPPSKLLSAARASSLIRHHSSARKRTWCFSVGSARGVDEGWAGSKIWRKLKKPLELYDFLESDMWYYSS